MLRFSQFIARFKATNLDDTLTKELNKAVLEAQKFAKPAEINLTIKVNPKHTGEVLVTAKHNSKLPKRDTMESIMFSTPQGDLLDNDPNQSEMFDTVKVIEGGETVSKKINQ